MVARLRLRRLLLTLVSLLIASFSAEAQEIYRQSWTFGGSTLAETIIRGLNEWSTRENPSAPTARLETDIRAEVLAEYVPSTGRVRRVLTGLAVGPFLFGEEINTILPHDLVDLIVRRDYLWQEEQKIIIDPFLSDYPLQVSVPPQGDTRERSARRSLRPAALSIRLGRDYKLWADVGATHLGMPGLTYGALLVGLRNEPVSAWVEVPLGMVESEGPVTGPTSREQHGFGAAAVLGSWRGRINFVIPDRDSSEDSHLRGTAALEWFLPIPETTLGRFALRFAAGGGFWAVDLPVIASERGLAARRVEVTPFGAISAELIENGGGLLHRATVSVATSFVAADMELRFTPMVGIVLGASASGLPFETSTALPDFGIHLSPVLRF